VFSNTKEEISRGLLKFGKRQDIYRSKQGKFVLFSTERQKAF
jgi:hypothetical protein